MHVDESVVCRRDIPHAYGPCVGVRIIQIVTCGLVVALVMTLVVLWPMLVLAIWIDLGYISMNHFSWSELLVAVRNNLPRIPHVPELPSSCSLCCHPTAPRPKVTLVYTLFLLSIPPGVPVVVGPEPVCPGIAWSISDLNMLKGSCRSAGNASGSLFAWRYTHPVNLGVVTWGVRIPPHFASLHYWSKDSEIVISYV